MILLNGICRIAIDRWQKLIVNTEHLIAREEKNVQSNYEVDNIIIRLFSNHSLLFKLAGKRRYSWDQYYHF
jgi:hypothetical protein